MIHVVIPVFNRLSLTKACIKSLKKQKNCETINIIIVDDGSTDGTTVYFKKFFPEIKIIKGTGELYWGGSIKVGIDYVIKIAKKNDWLLIVNNDVSLCFNTVSELIKLSNYYKRNALVSSISIDAKDKKTIIKTGTIVKSWFFNTTVHLFQNMNFTKLKKKDPVEVDIFTGRCLLHPIEIFKKIGNYNSNYFMHYGGDDEFSMRAKRYGFKNLLCLNSKVFLHNNVVTKYRDKNIKNFFYFLFNKKSSSNLIDKIKITIKIVPFYAKASYLFIGIIKSMHIFFKK